MKRSMLFIAVLALSANVHAGLLDRLFSSSSPAEFHSAEGRFSVKTPATLKESTVTKNVVLSNDGKSINLTTHQFAGSQNEVVYSVNYCDYPEWVFTLADPAAITEALLNSSGVSLTTLSNGKLLLETKIGLDSYPGREVIVEFQERGQKAIIKARHYMVGRRHYQIMTTAPSGKDGVSDINAFLDSFQLLK